MMGFEPIPRFSRERILSPLCLPFPPHRLFSLTRVELLGAQFYSVLEFVLER